MGLSLSHNCTLRVANDLLTISPDFEHEQVGGGKRGNVQGFSKGSRFRLFRLMHSLHYDKVLFVTLTYGKTYPADGRGAKVDLKRYRTNFERRWGKVRCIWRMEFQDRGAAHFHIMYLDAPFIPIADLENLWCDARRCPPDERHGNSVDIDLPTGSYSTRLVSKYIGKYVAKVERGKGGRDGKDDGRIWGKWNIDDPEMTSITITDYEKEKLLERIFEVGITGEWRPDNYDAFTLFGPQMGNDSLLQLVTRELVTIFERTRRWDNVFVTNDTVKAG